MPKTPHHRRRGWGARVVPLAALTVVAGTGWLSAVPASSAARVGTSTTASTASSTTSLTEIAASRHGTHLSRGGSRVLLGAERLEAIESRANRKVHKEWARERAEKRRRAAIREARQWGPPLTSYHITAGFGQSSSLWSSLHTGVDLDSFQHIGILSLEFHVDKLSRPLL